MPQTQREVGTSLSEINMVPFIDVVLVLLIIFMITAPILQSGIDVDVPKTKTVKELTEARMVVTIDRGQQVYLNDKPVNIHEIGQKVVVAIARPKEPVRIRAVRRNGAVRQLGDGSGCVAAIGNHKYQRGDAANQRAPTNTMRWQPSPQSARIPRSSDSSMPPSDCTASWWPGSWCRRYLPVITENWGGPGGSVTVNVVGSVPAIPLPQPDVESMNRVVDNSKGLFQTEPKPIPKPEPDATPIPKFQKTKPPKYVTKPSKVLENPTPPPPNAVPYGGGGTPTVPRTSFAMGSGNTQASLGFTGTAGGDFGSRFSWYVEAVQRRVSGNWLQSTRGP